MSAPSRPDLRAGVAHRCARGLGFATASTVLLCASASAADAYFERLQTSARATSFGRAYGAIVDDASAAYANPAALVAMTRSEALLNYAKPFNVAGYQTAYLAAAFPRDGLSFGAYWHHAGVSDVLGENLVGVAVARDLLAPGGNFALAAGGTLKLAQVGFSPEDDVDYGSETKVTADLSARLDYTERWSLSWTVHNVVEPEFDFVSAGGGTELARIQEFGVGLRWNPESTVALSLAQNALQDWHVHVGGEVWFQDVFSVRSGFVEGDYAGGVGLLAGGYLVDVAFLTNQSLGVSYEVSLRVPFGDPRW